MKEMITLCGDNCLECPRYRAKTTEELSKVAELWYRTGLRDTIVSNEEISCTGCSSHKQCTYNLFTCTNNHKVRKCNQCDEYTCEKIANMLKRSKEYETQCHELCTVEEYEMLEKAFFNKENYLNQ